MVFWGLNSGPGGQLLGWGEKQYGLISWKCSKEQRLELGTFASQRMNSYMGHLSSCFSYGPRMHFNFKSYLEKQRIDEGVDLSTLDGWATIHLQVKRSGNVLMTEFLEVSLYTNSSACHGSSASTLLMKPPCWKPHLIERQLRKWILHFQNLKTCSTRWHSHVSKNPKGSEG